MNKKENILVVITTWNQSDITRQCLESLQLISDDHDVLIIDDKSTDDTIELCKEYNVNYITKDVGRGLTDSWNEGYQYFKEHNYEYFVIANNDILIPNLALTEMKGVLSKWPCSLVVPLSTELGAGHNPMQRIDNWYGANEYNEPTNYQVIQSHLLELKATESKSNNLYKFDPEFINVKNEDEFNWANLIPNNDFPMLCKTAFIYHWKGMSTYQAVTNYSDKSNNKEWIKNRT